MGQSFAFLSLFCFLLCFALLPCSWRESGGQRVQAEAPGSGRRLSEGHQGSAE